MAIFQPAFNLYGSFLHRFTSRVTKLRIHRELKNILILKHLGFVRTRLVHKNLYMTRISYTVFLFPLEYCQPVGGYHLLFLNMQILETGIEPVASVL